MARHVDHLAIAIHDLESASSTLETAGFVVTPRADHPFGTSNRLVVFVDTYLELVAVTRAELIPEAGFAAEVAAFIASGEGISHAVVSSEDPIADHAFLADRGLANGDIFEFSRPAPRADGSVNHSVILHRARSLDGVDRSLPVRPPRAGRGVAPVPPGPSKRSESHHRAGVAGTGAGGV